jgi:hypothetical protein
MRGSSAGGTFTRTGARDSIALDVA